VSEILIVELILTSHKPILAIFSRLATIFATAAA